jgi:hypothetical protein
MGTEDKSDIDPAVAAAAKKLHDAYDLLRVSPNKKQARDIVLQELDNAVVVTEAVEQKGKLKPKPQSNN